jgi:Flp pilus assembly protein TadD
LSCRINQEISSKEYAKIGTKAFKLKLYSEAEFRFKQAVEKEPKNPEYLNNLAVICEILGKIEEAKNYYNEALKIAPNNKKIKENYERFENYIKLNYPAP